MIGTAAIVGAGIGGVTAGLALARRGWAVTVYEQAPAWEEVGAGLQLGPNAMRVLAALDVDVRAVSDRPDRVELRDGLSGRIEAIVPFGPRAEARYGEIYVQLHRQDLLAALGTAATAAGVRFEMGRTVTPQASPEADLIVAADGVRSAFRKSLHPIVSPEFTGQVAWRALIDGGGVPSALNPDATQLLLGPGRHMVLYPLRGGKIWNLVAVEERTAWADEGWNRADDVANLNRAFEGWAAPVPQILDRVDTTILWGLFAHQALPSWRDGTTCLLGDACHPMLPFLAQGAAMAIEDAWVLADSVSTLGVSDGLSRYEALRKPRTTRVQRTARGNARVYHLSSPLARGARRAGLAAAQRLPGGLLRRFDWLYGADVTGGSLGSGA
ncbi:MAG: FAD-dependent monooxygenase [Pseudomonadota bacterium]